MLEVLALAVILGVKHALEPDHLAAVTTLLVSEPDQGRVKAARLGAAWGLGHSTSLVLFGLPVIFFGAYLPETVQQFAEFTVGVMIVSLALNLLWRWRKGAFHAHAHNHGIASHRHVHHHESSTDHAHSHVGQRSLKQSYGIGVVHGVGGTAGVALLVLADTPDPFNALAALIWFALGTIISMIAMTSVLGSALSKEAIFKKFLFAIPGMGLLSLAFGAYYALGAV